MHTRTNEAISPLKLFQQMGRAIRRSKDPDQMLKGAVEEIGWHFSLDRCVAMLMDEREHELVIHAEYNREPLKPIGSRRYQLLSGSEVYRLLSEGRPLPLSEIQAEVSPASTQPELDRFIKDSNSKSVIAFPLLAQGSLLGCLTLHHCQEDRKFSEDILELGEAFADELASAFKQSNLLQAQLVDGKVFAGSALPLIVLESGTFKICQSNSAAAKLLDSNESDLIGLPFLELLADGDATAIRKETGKLSPNNPVAHVPGLLVPGVGGESILLNAALSTVSNDGKDAIVVALLPSVNNAARLTAASSMVAAPADERADELVASLSRQLSVERLIRQIVSKLHSSLDRDTVLQAAADSVGRGLRASTCLIVRTDSPAVSIVTHEYADPNLSPLGLGRSGQLPAGVITHFRQRTICIADMASPNRPAGMSKEDANSILDGGVGAILSTPIAFHGQSYGIIVVQNHEPRQWAPQEVEMLETIAQQAALALANAQAYAQVKDQLFNMNLIGNLTQQLTNALELAGRTTRNDRPVDINPTEAPTTPLSTRELEVLKLIASGLANREIAQKLFLTESTVELHASRIRKKLKLKSRTALVKYACDNHLV